MLVVPWHLMTTKLVPLCFGLACTFCAALSSLANPVGGSVAGGDANATISGQGTALTTINQTANRVIINWQDFSIGAGEVTRFVQPSGRAAALNRIMSGNPSEIYGSLQANGRVFVINPSGILVGPGGQIDTKAFVASTLDVSDASFKSGGNLIFTGTSAAAIRNQGSIQALGGDVYLIAHNVENSGSIRAPQGNVGLAAGNTVELVQSGNEHLSVLVGNSDAPSGGTGVNNLGTIEAASAELKAAGGNIYALAINNGGTVRANGIVHKNGHIYFGVTGGNIQNSGTLSARNADGSGGTITVDAGHSAASPSSVVNSGAVLARGDAPGASGGNVEVLGDRVGLFDGTTVDVSGSAGGGTALVGGDTHGANPDVQNAQVTYVSPAAQIKADAGSSGNGGKVVVWSDDRTRFDGSISAKAGGTKWKRWLRRGFRQNQLGFNGTVDLSAQNGVAGTLLLDPATFTVQASNPDLNGDGTTGDDLATLTDLSNPNNLPGVDSIITAGAVNTLLAGSSTLILAATGQWHGERPHHGDRQRQPDSQCAHAEPERPDCSGRFRGSFR